MRCARAVTKHVRISPRKARLAAGLIRGLMVNEAKIQLLYSKLKGGRLLKKTLDSAVANAEVQLDAKKEDLRVQEVRIDGGASWKRGKSRSKGSYMPFLKRTSHFTVIVSCE